MYEWYYREKKTTLAEICEITEVYHNTEDPDYKKVLKYYFLAIYKEFKDIFLKNKVILYPRFKIIIIKLN